MTKQEFNNYKFGVKTEVLFDDEWWFVQGVDFKDNTILLKEHRTWICYQDVEEIRN